MTNQFLNQKTPNEIAKSLADKIKENRKKLKISQEALAQKSGVSLGSIKRFETKYEISLQSFIKIAIALDLDNDFENLFTQKYDAFAIVFEYLIKDYNKDFGKYAEYYTPNSIARIIARILVKDDEKIENVTVYDPSAGSRNISIGSCTPNR